MSIPPQLPGNNNPPQQPQQPQQPQYAQPQQPVQYVQRALPPQQGQQQQQQVVVNNNGCLKLIGYLILFFVVGFVLLIYGCGAMLDSAVEDLSPEDRKQWEEAMEARGHTVK
jgi:hypothetical protein